MSHPSSADASPRPISAARLNANRRNALKSTGPITEAGKARVRLNAWKHGFRAESDAVAPEESEAVALRRAEWASAFPCNPDDGHQRWLVNQLTLASVRIDRCQQHQRHQWDYEADRAASWWDVDRSADASNLGASLSKDPDRVVSSLRRSAAGIDWLLDRWHGLASQLDDEGCWDDAQRRLCLDLMQTPDEFRSSDDALLARLPLDELRELVRERIDGLDSLRDSARQLDESDRSLAEIGMPTTEGSGLSRLRRYETALWRRFRSFESSYRKTRPPAPAFDDSERDARPLSDLVAFSRMLETDPAPHPDASPGPRPEPEAATESAPPEPPVLSGPPGPRPSRHASLERDRNRDRDRDQDSDPDQDRDPIDALPADPLSLPTLPTPSGLATLLSRPPSEPPILMNRRARRALKKRRG